MSGVDMTPDECAMNGLDPYPEEHDAGSDMDTIEREWWIRCRYMNGLDVDPADLVGDGWRFKPCGVDWCYWLERPAWTADQAAHLAVGVDPLTKPEMVCPDAETTIRQAALDICSLPPRPPADWVQVLVDAGFDDLPPPLFGLLDDESASRGYLELRELALSRRGSVPQAEPARDESQGKPSNIVKRCVLIAHIEPIMKEPDKLAGLLSNASKSGLSEYRAPGGWCLGEVAMWLLMKGYLKPEISKKYIDTLIEQTVNNS